MIVYPKSLQKLIDSFKLLPGVGEKTAERYALAILEKRKEDVLLFAKSLEDVQTKLRECERCHNLSEDNLCAICQDEHRDQRVICVVASVKELASIEKSGSYHGQYHVLGGLISSKKGILPEDLHLSSLYRRLEDVDEVILALNATVDGEMTALYLDQKIKDRVEVTRLAFGLPIGGHLDYADDLTLHKAFEGRSKME